MNKWHFFSSFTVFLFILLLLLLSFPFFNFFFTFFRLFESFRTRNVGGEVRIEKPEMNAMIGSKAPDLAVPEGSKFLPFPEFVVKSFFTDVH